MGKRAKISILARGKLINDKEGINPAASDRCLSFFTLASLIVGLLSRGAVSFGPIAFVFSGAKVIGRNVKSALSEEESTAELLKVASSERTRVLDEPTSSSFFDCTCDPFLIDFTNLALFSDPCFLEGISCSFGTVGASSSSTSFFLEASF